MNEPAHLNSQEQFAAEEDILRWLAEAAQVFRVSSLPKQGKKLYVQMIDTAFKNFTGTVVPWFSEHSLSWNASAGLWQISIGIRLGPLTVTCAQMNPDH